MNTTYDMPDNYYYGGGGQESVVTPLAAFILFAAIVLICWLPRKWIIVPLLVAGVMLPYGINVVALGLHFPALRLLVAAGVVRYVVRRDLKFPQLNNIDRLFILWCLSDAISFSILWGTIGAVTNRLGFLWTTLGVYFLVRALVREKTDIVTSIEVLAVLTIVIAMAMETEHLTRHNVFSIVGAPALSEVRNGAIRASGPFGHPIIAGTIGAVLMPVFAGLWWQEKRHKLLAGMGVLASTVMVIASSSSTPIITYAAGAAALLLWSKREHLKFFRWLFVLVIIALHLIMKAPVWFLIARAGASLGSSGYHRAMLIDNFIRHVGEWWLVGTQYNAYWGYDMWDVDNAYVAAGIEGGLLTLVLFLALLAYTFKQIGESRRQAQRSRQNERLLWAIGASIFSNVIAFFGIVYFDQSVLVWSCILAMVSVTQMFIARNNDDNQKLRDNRQKKEQELESSAIPQYCSPWG